MKNTLHTVVGLFTIWTVGCNLTDFTVVPGLSNITPVYTSIERGDGRTHPHHEWMSHTDYQDYRVNGSKPSTHWSNVGNTEEEEVKEVESRQPVVLDTMYNDVEIRTTNNLTGEVNYVNGNIYRDSNLGERSEFTVRFDSDNIFRFTYVASSTNICRVDFWSPTTRNYEFLEVFECGEEDGYFSWSYKNVTFVVPTPPVCDQRSMTTTGYGECVKNWSHVK